MEVSMILKPSTSVHHSAMCNACPVWRYDCRTQHTV